MEIAVLLQYTKVVSTSPKRTPSQDWTFNRSVPGIQIHFRHEASDKKWIITETLGFLLNSSYPVWWSPMNNSCWPQPIGSEESVALMHGFVHWKLGDDTGNFYPNTSTIGITIFHKMLKSVILLTTNATYQCRGHVKYLQDFRIKPRTLFLRKFCIIQTCCFKCCPKNFFSPEWNKLQRPWSSGSHEVLEWPLAGQVGTCMQQPVTKN